MTRHVSGQEASIRSESAERPASEPERDATTVDASEDSGASSDADDAATTDADPLASNSDPAPAACASDGDCVLVTGGCAGPMAAHQTQAESIDARHQRMRSSAYCGNAPMARPVRAVCTQARCVIEPMDHPEWRVCERTRECMPLRRRCTHWQSINRRFEREARDADRPCTESSAPEAPPRIECQYGWCVAGWGGR